MDQSTAAPKTLKSIFPRLNSWTSFELLFFTLIGIFLVWFVKFHWNRRKLYLYSRKVPGPVAYPIIGSALLFRGGPYHAFEALVKLFDEHSTIFKIWFGPKCFYATADPKHMEILLPNCLEKGRWYDHINCLIGEGLLTAKYHTWKIHRKTVSPTFNQRILNKFVPIFNKQSNILIEQLQQCIGKSELDIFTTISNCTLDIICESVMGVTVNAQKSNSPFSQCLDRILEILVIKVCVFWYHIHPIFRMTRLSKDLHMCLKTIHDFTRQVVNEKITQFENNRQQLGTFDDCSKEGPSGKALLDYLLDMSHKENSIYSEKDLLDEVVTFIVAGSDTTAVTNGFIFIMLGLHQDLQEKVYNEVMDILGPDRDVEPEDLPRFKYLERFIKETLRLFPAGPLVFREIHKDIDLGDIIVPAGVSVFFSIITLHRNEIYWKDPLQFDPDRFLTEEILKRHPCSYIPFSYGPRNCIGLKFAMMAMKALVVNVLRKYKIYTSYTCIEDIKLKCNVVMRPKDGFKVNIELR